MALSRFSLREISQRPLRTIITILSIAIGVGAVVAVMAATRTTRKAQRDMLKVVSGKADLEILGNDNAGFDYQLVTVVRELPNVEVAVPSLQRYATLFAEGNRQASIQVMGIDPRIDQQVRPWELESGRLPTQLKEILLDHSLAASLGINVDSTVKLLTPGGFREFTVVGLVRPTGTSMVVVSSAAYFILPAAQQAFRTGTKIDQVQLIIKSDAEVATVAAELNSLLPKGVTVRRPRQSNAMANETVFATENGLLLSIAFALLIAAFIIYNTFQMSVGERRKQLGILRAVGATSGQIQWMILREAVWLTIPGAAMGCVWGAWGAKYVASATANLMQVEIPRVQFDWWPFAVAVIFGASVSLLGAGVPAFQAGRVSPVEAIRAVYNAQNERLVRFTFPFSWPVMAFGFVILVAAINNRLPLGGDVVGILLILIGSILTLPRILQPFSTWLAFHLYRLLGVEGILAQKQLVRQLGRSSLTIGVIFLALSTSSGLAGNILDNVANVRQWYSKSVVGDFFVRASKPDLSSGAAAAIPDVAGERLQRIEGIQNLDPMRMMTVQVGEASILLVVRNFTSGLETFFDMVEGSEADAKTGLLTGKVVIGTVLSQRLNLHRGDKLPLETAQGTYDLEIVGTTNEYLGGGLTVFMHRPAADKLLSIQGVDAYIVKANTQHRAELEKELTVFCQQEGLILQSYSDLVSDIDRITNSVIACLWMLLALGCVIAALGLINTLTMNILEQTRELGMLRIIAMTRSQVRRMIFAQALYLGIIGLIPGALAGIAIQYLISLSAYSVLGHNVEFQLRPALSGGGLLMGFTIVLLASYLPAERAARLKLATALNCE
ncbi:MAG: ABC transporter permease [Planctomycetales bacterium]|nr:ABC transporter permease [Planctomycetales bacterium]